MKPKLEIFPSSAIVAGRGAELFLLSALNTLNSHSAFHAVLSGGRTPIEMYRAIEVHPLHAAVDWRRVHLYWGDERVVAFSNEQSNFGQSWRAWLSRSIIPAAHLHPFRTDLGVDEAAFQLSLALPRSFDLAFLGIGEDGHTASLFPENPWPGLESPPALALWIPQLKSWRLSLAPATFTRARQVVFMVTGVAKASALQHTLQGDSRSSGPARRILDTIAERALILADTEAASLLPDELKIGLTWLAA